MLTFPERKRIRAGVIAKYAQDAGYAGVICFSCGNAAAALRDEGLEVLEIGPCGELQTGRWWKAAQIHKCWPQLFDATSGHLPGPVLVSISRAFSDFLGPLPKDSYDVPTGSGETILCLRWAYPAVTFNPVYDLDRATRFEVAAPLNWAVNGPPSHSIGGNRAPAADRPAGGLP